MYLYIADTENQLMKMASTGFTKTPSVGMHDTHLVII